MITFELLKDCNLSWRAAMTFENLNAFQTRPWLEFVAVTHKAKPVVAAIQDEGRTIGHFFGLVGNKFGLRVLGSPLRGWNTDFMGFSCEPGASKGTILKAFPKFAFGTLGCHYLEIIDPTIRMSDCDDLSFDHECLPRFVLDLTKSEDEIFAKMKSSCRNLIRQAIRNGVTIEVASDSDFAGDYHAQLQEVFAKQSLHPPYGPERVRTLIDHMLPSGNLLLLRARDPSGNCIATGIFLALNHSAVYWGAASWKEFQHLRPNELMTWHGMKYWKARGIREFHFGGGWEQYKSKFGCEEIPILRLMKCRNASIDLLRKAVMMPRNARLRNWAIRRF